tara:strand:- start:2216 stop:3400 length:1185 start_codon:yes stop_codon:yes gene_type:complete
MAQEATQAYLQAHDVEKLISAAVNAAVHEKHPNCTQRVGELLLQSASPKAGPLTMMRSVPAENAAVEAWLATATVEPVLEPDLPIIDAHHHLWDQRKPAPWFSFRTKFYGPAELAHDIASSGHNVVGTVFVQCGSHHLVKGPAEFRPCGEVEYCQGVAATCESSLYPTAPRLCWGVVGYADLRHPNIDAVLERMARCRSFRGVRGAGEYDADFKRGVAALAARGLVLDRWLDKGATDPTEMPKLAALAREFPSLTIVLNHLGGVVGPALADDAAALAAWRANITELAGCPNVVCKCGALHMVASGLGLEKRTTPVGSDELLGLTFSWYEHAIRAFGPSRCMFESNFPVDRDCVPYATLLNMFKKLANRLGLSEEEKADIFAGTARRVYRLSEEE